MFFKKWHPFKSTPKTQTVNTPTDTVSDKIGNWQSGSKLIIENVDVDCFNNVNEAFQLDKTDRGFRFDYDQDNQILTVSDD